MKLAKASTQIGTNKGATSAWKGLTLREGATGGTLVWGSGLTSEEFPAMRTHNGDVKEGIWAGPTGLFAWDELVVADGSTLYYGEDGIATVNGAEKQFAVVGTKLVVWPDKIIVDLVNGRTTKMEATYTTVSAATFTGNTITAAKIPVIENEEGRYGMHGNCAYIRVYSSVSFSNGSWSTTGGRNVKLDLLEEGDIFIPYETDAGDFEPNVNWKNGYSAGTIYQYQDNGKGIYCTITELTRNDVEYTLDGGFGFVWFEYTSRNYTNQNVAWNTYFAVGDTVKISGCTSYTGNNGVMAEITAIDASANKLTFSSNTFHGSGETWTDGPITVTRAIPSLDFICEKDNRLWGVSNASTGKVWNADANRFDTVYSRVIYASALGDPLQFYDFNGISTDSYAVAVGSANDFTGIVNYNGAILCFKEDLVHRITGDYPANYYMYTDVIEGVASDATKSMVVVNEVLYYKGRAGVYAYTGGQPNLISYSLGPDKYTGGAGGTDGINYYISMMSGTTPMLFCYDGVHGVWMHHGAIAAKSFARLNGQAYYSTATGVYKFESGTKAGESWEMALAPYDEDVYSLKQYCRIAVTLRLEGEATCTFYGQFDQGERMELFTVTNVEGVQQVYKLRYLPPKRAHRFRVFADGEGDVTIRSIEREFINCSEEE